MKIVKRQKFDMAHAIHGYPGPCRFLHGHTWMCEIEFCFVGTDEQGISVDFKVLKDIMNEILPDHCLLLSSKWDDDLLDVLEKYFTSERVHVLPFEPTAENLSKWLHGCFDKRFKGLELKNIKVDTLRVRVWESDTAYCEYP